MLKIFICMGTFVSLTGVLAAADNYRYSSSPNSSNTYQANPKANYQNTSRTYQSKPDTYYYESRPTRQVETNRASSYYSERSPTYQPYSNENVSEGTIIVTNNPKYGKILTDSKGMTLYIFTPDNNNTSTCYEQCSVEWPPLLTKDGQPSLANGITGQLETIRRRDNTRQVSYNGMPLYYYHKDKKPGDVTGQNVDKKWFVINPNSGR